MTNICASRFNHPVFYAYEFAGYNDPSQFGKRSPIVHSETYADGAAHVNNLVGFGPAPWGCTGPATAWT